jgi:hypothetical protein
MKLQEKKTFYHQIVKGQSISLFINTVKCQSLLVYVNFIMLGLISSILVNFLVHFKEIKRYN